MLSFLPAARYQDCAYAWLCRVFFVAIGLVTLYYLARSPPKEQRSTIDKQERLEVLHECKNPTVDIVAVHGLGANPKHAWVWNPEDNPPGGDGYPDRPFNWLKELLPTKLHCRVLAFNFDSAWISQESVPKQRLSHISGNLLRHLCNARNEARNRPIIFIGHSFGGLVIEHALASGADGHHHIAPYTVGTIFLGTPFRGSPAADWALLAAALAPKLFFSTEARLMATVKVDSDMMKDCLINFSKWVFLNSIPVICCFEKYETAYFFNKPKTLVVNEDSACIDISTRISLDRDHRKLNKFYGADDSSFKTIYDEICRIAHGAEDALRFRQNPRKIPNDANSTPEQLKKCLKGMKVESPEFVLQSLERKGWERVPGTCNWILQQEELLSWGTNAAESQLLCLVGDPGMGKTMLSMFLVEELKKKVEKSRHGVFAYFFCDDKCGRNTQTAVLRSLIWQFLVQNDRLFHHIKLDFERHPSSYLLNDFSALWSMFQRMLHDETLGDVFILIDALDECERSNPTDLLISIRSLFQPPAKKALGKLKILATYRNGSSNIDSNLRGVGTRLKLNSDRIRGDLTAYINAKVDELAARQQYEKRTQRMVREHLTQHADGTFLWLSLVIAELGQPSVLNSEVPGILARLPTSLHGIYSTILDRITESDQAMFILHCIAVAGRPLTAAEVRAALAVKKKGARSIEQVLWTYNDILKTCDSIVRLTGSGENATLAFCHQTVKDFLLQEGLETKKWYHTTEDDANFGLFSVCWKYLSDGPFQRGSQLFFEGEMSDEKRVAQQSSLQTLFGKHTLLNYAYNYWRFHATAISWDLEERRRIPGIGFEAAPALRDALIQSAAAQGNLSLTHILLRHGANIETKDELGRTPLCYAATNPDRSVMRLLLEHGADINAQDKNHWTPAFMATITGISTEWLVDNGANIERKDRAGMQLLHLAGFRGDLRALGELLGKGADIEARDPADRTLLCVAASHGQVPVMELLLQNGADIEARNGLGDETPLCVAAYNGQAAATKLLLEKGADIEAKNTLGETPLCLAASNGHEPATKLLLEEGADIEAKNKFGETPLFLATRPKHEAVVQMLLGAAGNTR